MPRPAARQTDSLAMNGMIVQGFSTVLIGGLAAARQNDATGCLPHPGPPPIVFAPHPGFVMGPCAQTVRIGGLAAAGKFDVTLCLSMSPNLITGGCPTVLLATPSFADYAGMLIPDTSSWFTLLVPIIPVIIAWWDGRMRIGDALWVKSVVAFNTNLAVYVNTAAAGYLALAAAVVAAVVVAPVKVFAGAHVPARASDEPLWYGDVDTFLRGPAPPLIEEEHNAAMYLL